MKTIIKNKEQEIDWNKVQLVQSRVTNDIVLVIQDGSIEGEFEGIKLSNGDFSRNWDKNFFHLFDGEVTLKND